MNKHSNIGQDYLAIVRKLHAAGIAVFAGFVFGGDFWYLGVRSRWF